MHDDHTFLHQASQNQKIESVRSSSIKPRGYFFFFGFFFFTPPDAGVWVGIALDGVWTGRGLARSFSAGGSTSWVVTGADGGSSWRFWFCIFCIRDWLRDSNRLRKMDEFVLNLTHWTTLVRQCVLQFLSMYTHCDIIRDFQDQFSFWRLPFYTVPSLRREFVRSSSSKFHDRQHPHY